LHQPKKFPSHGKVLLQAQKAFSAVPKDQALHHAAMESWAKASNAYTRNCPIHGEGSEAAGHASREKLTISSATQCSLSTVSGRHYQPTVPISSAPPAPPPLLLLCLRHHNEGGGYSVSPATRSGPAQLGYLTDRVVGVSAIDTGEGRPNIDRESGIDRPSQIRPV